MGLNQDSTQPACIVWFREDLRLADNPALTAAVASGHPVICLFILDDETPYRWRYGGAARWWLNHSLTSLSKQIAKAGNKLVFRRGKTPDVLTEIIDEAGVCKIFWNRRYAPFHIQEDKDLKEQLEKNGLEVSTFNGRLLFEPWEIRNKSGDPYRVFTPFWKAIQIHDPPSPPLPAIDRIPAPKALLRSNRIEDWRLTPSKPDWAVGFSEDWHPGTEGASKRLGHFFERAAATYKEDRNRPDLQGTSGLSPHLQFGEISPRQIWHATQSHIAKSEVPEAQAMVFLSEVVWREFSYSLLYYNSDMLDQELNPKFQQFPWGYNGEALKAWQKGQTGYPIVDAGMRQLWQTGWMHNRVRMIVGSFLVKHLLIDWREGMNWFWDTLVDADIASNTASWQWIAGCGADAAPYFRIFNPMTQGEKFDPAGDYVRKFVPELQKVPEKHIHTPWEAPADVLEQAGVVLGETYPYPIVDHSIARKEALAAYEMTK